MVTEQDWKPGAEFICVETNSARCVIKGQIYPVNHNGNIMCGCNLPIGPAASWRRLFNVYNPLGPW